jgi:hypothetical protein
MRGPEHFEAKSVLDSLNVPMGEARVFVQNTNDTRKGWAGATMDLGTGKTMRPGEPGHVVGGEPSEIAKTPKGKPAPIATHIYGNSNPTNAKLSLLQFANEAARIRAHSSNERTTIGSWYEPNSSVPEERGIQIDAGRVTDDIDEAGRLVHKRNQDGSWDNSGQGRVITFAEHAKRMKKKLTQNKQAKNNIRVPEDAAPATDAFNKK